MVLATLAFQFGEPVVPKRQLDPREDRLGLYLWATIAWHLLIGLGTVVLVVGGRALLHA